MTNVISELSKYLIIILMILYTFQCFTIFRKHYEEDKRHVPRKQIVLMLFMNFVAYAVLYLQTEDTNMILMYLAVLVFIVLVQILYRVIYRKANMLVVNNMCMLLSIGFLMLSRLQFDRAVKQFAIASAAMLLSLIVPVIVRKVKHLKDLTWLYGIAGLLMLVAVLGLAAVTGGAKLSIEIGDFTFQFSELVKIIFVFFVAGMLREDTSFRQVVITTAVAGATCGDSGAFQGSGKRSGIFYRLPGDAVCGYQAAAVCAGGNCGGMRRFCAGLLPV
ncbi:MAG: FtsW/RodA/SpoVE family cell cycle protein [Lachnospiraceae bacterium]